MHVSVHGSTTDNNQIMWTTKEPNSRWAGYIHNRLLLNYIKWWTLAMCKLQHGVTGGMMLREVQRKKTLDDFTPRWNIKKQRNWQNQTKSYRCTMTIELKLPEGMRSKGGRGSSALLEIYGCLGGGCGIQHTSEEAWTYNSNHKQW